MSNTNKNPLVSVIMPVRNAGDFLEEAIDSILSQTYKNLELIIINDASKDNTSDVLSLYKKEKRVRIFNNKKKLGVTKSTNLGISKAKGMFVARMDGDDISYSTRIQKQVQFLLKNSRVVALGGQCDLIDSKGILIGKKKFPTDNRIVKEMIFRSVPVQQPALMVNTNLVPRNFAWYDENYTSAEELELLFKLFAFGKIQNLKNSVLKYRIHGGNTSLKHPKKTFYLTLKTRIKAVLEYGYRPSFKSIMVTLAQIFVVSLLPEKWIYPIYSYVRGMKKFDPKSVKINLDGNFIFEKALRLVKV